MTDLAQLKDTTPPDSSPWSKLIVEAMLAERADNPRLRDRQCFIDELARRLAALKDWERYDRNNPPTVALKRNYEEVAKLTGHTNWVRAIHALPDGSILSGSGRTIMRFSSQGGDSTWLSETIGSQQGHVEFVQGLPNGRIVAGSSSDLHGGTLSLWAPRGEEWKVESAVHFPGKITCLQACPDGSIVTGYENGELILYSPNSNRESKRNVILRSTPALALQVLNDWTIVTGHAHGFLRVWTPSASGTCRQQAVHHHGITITALQNSCDGRIVIGDGEGAVGELVPRGNGIFTWSIIGRHGGQVTCLQALPDGRIVSGGYDNTIRIWERDSSGAWQHEILRGHLSGVSSLQVLPDGRIISSSYDCTIRIWDGIPVTDGGVS